MGSKLDLTGVNSVVLTQGQMVIKQPTVGDSQYRNVPNSNTGWHEGTKSSPSIIAAASVACQMNMLFQPEPISFGPMSFTCVPPT